MRAAQSPGLGEEGAMPEATLPGRDGNDKVKKCANGPSERDL